MEFTVKSGNPEKQRSACVVVGVFEPRRLSAAGQRLDDASGGYISALIRRGDMEGRLGQTLLLHNVSGTLCDRILLVGCGRERELADSQYRKLTTTAVKTLDETGSMEAVSYLTELPVKGRDLAWRVNQAVRTAHHALYRFDDYKSRSESTRRPLRKITLAVPNRRDLAVGERAVATGRAIAEGVHLARDLGNTPGNVCTPAWLAEQARELGNRYPGLSVSTLDRPAMEREGMGALLAVARGSAQEPQLITVEYNGGGDSRPVVLVGKGVTFDSGGISIKPGQGMDEMKYDMMGAAGVLGTLAAVAELELPLNVVGIVPAVENMPDGNAVKPGDVVTTLSGQTVEILNTDAEGRLILADALTWAERYDPEAVVDLATLTGACLVALGREASAVLGNHPPLVNDLLDAGRDSGDRAWELPLWEEYQEALKSNFADMANVGGREAGTITAGCFLSRYTRKMRWAHLDIAGSAWVTGSEKGATGRPVPLLTHYLVERSGG
ncbi:MAG: leucyl aminopeptidase [Pseudomonadota bacterium]